MEPDREYKCLAFIDSMGPMNIIKATRLQEFIQSLVERKLSQTHSLCFIALKNQLFSVVTGLNAPTVHYSG